MKRWPLILLLLVTVAFLYGLVRLFDLRFSTGDIYPEYSSLRADPLGTKAFYLSLDKLLATRRHYQSWARLGEGRETTLFYLGVAYDDLEFTRDQFRPLEAFVADGGRLVVSLLPSFQKRPAFGWRSRSSTTLSTNKPPAGVRPSARPKKQPFQGNDELAELRPVPITERWGFVFGHAELRKDDHGVYLPAKAERKADVPLPDSLACHTALFFDQLTNVWRVIYAREKDHAVAIERRLGRGSLVLLADSYYFSNEALRQDRHPELLAWLVGSSRQTVFDETHLGVEEEPGIATLAQKYRLHGVLVTLLLLAALLVWKNSVSFMPPYEEDLARERGERVAGKESAAGFVNLLRRNIQTSELLPTCIAEWNKSCRARVASARLQQMQSVIDAENAQPPKQRDPIAAYRKFCEILSKSFEFRVPSSEFNDSVGYKRKESHGND